MPPRKKIDDSELQGTALIKETNRRIRQAMQYWKAQRNKATRRERDRALSLYERMSNEEKDKVPQELRVWLRYRSEKYFGEDRTKPGKK